MTTTQPAPATAYVATFERIGRRHDVKPLPVSGSPDQIAEQVYRYSLGFFGSRDVEITVDLQQMKGFICWGRFGSFTLADVTASEGAPPVEAGEQR
jgi:hypothetical protein